MEANFVNDHQGSAGNPSGGKEEEYDGVRGTDEDREFQVLLCIYSVQLVFAAVMIQIPFSRSIYC